MSHSKAPWVVKAGSDDGYETLEVLFENPNSTYPLVCVVDAEQYMDTKLISPTPEQRANADLIAAAPDMYQMLLKLSDMTNGQGVHEEIEQLLSKARGDVSPFYYNLVPIESE